MLFRSTEAGGLVGHVILQRALGGNLPARQQGGGGQDQGGGDDPLHGSKQRVSRISHNQTRASAVEITEVIKALAGWYARRISEFRRYIGIAADI